MNERLGQRHARLLAGRQLAGLAVEEGSWGGLGLQIILNVGTLFYSPPEP
jgi:hypothetical protein